MATPNVIDVAEGIPFVALTDWDHGRLYELKGVICQRGIEQLTGLTMPAFEKNRFQRGAVDNNQFAQLFPTSPSVYRQVFGELFA